MRERERKREGRRVEEDWDFFFRPEEIRCDKMLG